LSPTLFPARITATFARSDGYVLISSAPALSYTNLNLLFRNTIPSSPQDHARQHQHLNTNFSSVHTATNRPTAKKSRHSPPSLAASVETSNSPLVPAIQAFTRSMEPIEESSRYGKRGRPPSVERCPVCYEFWSKPLMPTSEWRQDSPAESSIDFARATDTLFARLRQYGRETEEKYQQWKEKHSHCSYTKLPPYENLLVTLSDSASHHETGLSDRPDVPSIDTPDRTADDTSQAEAPPFTLSG
jgi:hypothetical protein